MAWRPVARGLNLAACGVLLAAACGRAEEPPGASLSPFAASEEQPVAAELIAEHASIQPGGTTRIGVHFEIEEGWHIYAQEPGDAGLPTQITWSVPLVSVSELHWPPHHEFLDPGDIRTFGYSGTVVLYSTLTYSPPRLRRMWVVREIPVQASVKWLACKEVCIPGSADLELTLPISSGPPVFSTHAQLFEHTD